MKPQKIHDRTTADLPINSSVAIAIVADPYSETGEQIQVIRSLRDDPLAWMHTHGQIDDAQFAAARKWQSIHGRSTIGGIKAIDPAKEAVDGGLMPEAITDHQIMAFQELAECAGELGFAGNRLVFAVLAEGKFIREVARDYGVTTQYGIKSLGRTFRGCLETLAIHFGLAPEKRRA